MRRALVLSCALLAAGCHDWDSLIDIDAILESEAGTGDGGHVEPEAGPPEPSDGPERDAGADGCTLLERFKDGDHDGFGDRASQIFTCTEMAGYVAKADDCDDACDACNPDGSEQCDAMLRDENCDGARNEQCACQPDTTMACGPETDIGECAFGEQACTEDATWGTCEGATLAVGEQCDGKDNDCDDRTDETVLNDCGECGEVPAETCNGEDDDCDDHTDEGTAEKCPWGQCGSTECGKVVELAAGGKHTCARLDSGAVYCWGENFQGQLGNGDTSQTSKNTPQRVVDVGGTGYLENVLGLTAGWQHTCARTASQVVCWGKNDMGQLANADAGLKSAVPVAVQPSVLLIAAKDVDAGDDFSCAVTATNDVFCWGSNLVGQLGNGTSGSGMFRPTADRVMGEGATGWLAGVNEISVGALASCAWQLGRVLCWGQNFFGAIGNGTTSSTPATSPTVVVRAAGTGAGELGSVASLAAGGDFGCALQTNQQAVCWGANSAGQLGVPASETGQQTGTPHLVDGESGPSSVLQNAAQLFASHGAHVCARQSNGRAVCWGGNYQGQLGDGGSGSSANRDHPVGVLGVGGSGRLQDIVTMSAGTNHTCALLGNGQVACWGMNDVGQLGNGEFASRVVVPVLVRTPR